jgi:hypothetical protein
MVDEINPLVFIDMIVELLFFFTDSNSLASSKTKDMPFYQGSAVALKTMLRFLSQLYGDTANVFNSLEIISILVKRICNQVYEMGRNLAINIAVRILIQELPNYAVRQHSETLMNTLFLIISQSKDSVVVTIEERVRPIIDMLLEALGIINMSSNTTDFSDGGRLMLDFNLIEAIRDPNAGQQSA